MTRYFDEIREKSQHCLSRAVGVTKAKQTNKPGMVQVILDDTKDVQKLFIQNH